MSREFNFEGEEMKGTEIMTYIGLFLCLCMAVALFYAYKQNKHDKQAHA